MKLIMTALFVAILTLSLSSTALADSVIESWTCVAEEGKEVADIQATNSKWLEWLRSNVDENIQSAVGTSIVGDATKFIFIDTYPDLATWAAAKEALDSEDAEVLEELFDDVMECSENRLWKVEDTK